MTIDELVESLTLEQAQLWAADTEQWFHVWRNHLDVHGLLNTARNVNAVELCFCKLLDDAKA